MRIKSYFAASVQAAIGMARREFGDEVTLVTSHVAAPDARHLGEYEVVFAVEQDAEKRVAEPEDMSGEKQSQKQATAGEQCAVAPFTGFQEVLLEAVRPKAVAPDDQGLKLDRLRCALVDLGLEAATTAAVMTLVEKSLPADAAAIGALVETAEEHEAETAAGRVRLAKVEKADGSPVVRASGKRSHLSSAELCFISSVAGSPGAEVAQTK